MKALFSLFPTTDFSLLAVVLGMPLLGAFINGVFGRRLGKSAVRLMALSAIGVSFLAACVSFLALTYAADATKTLEEGHAHYDHVKLAWTAWEWMRASGLRDVAVPIDLRFSIDALSGVMMLVVTGVGFLIHLYATSYMGEDDGFYRFFAYLNLFVFSMLVLILGDNLAVLFIGWEGVGLCSYLLIGFWYPHLPNAAAGRKAFLANRIGDFGLLCAMFLLVYYTGSLDWSGIAAGSRGLVFPPELQQVHLWPIGGGQFQDLHLFGVTLPLHLIQPSKPITITAATAVGLALFLGCTGKSAQIPLYVWLPDAMAGPTPVSALIHAATMVTAGIYLVCRLSFVFVLSPVVMTVVAFTGVFTAVLAATIALVQTDVKKVLAYSTVSQLGFMVLGVGVGAFSAGFFHVFTHAFFKACLFLAAGSVIHAMHARVHDDDRAQDMRNMGGLRRSMPVTYAAFAAATLAIIGFPLTSGWFSKDEILASALANKSVSPFAEALGANAWSAPSWVPWTLWTLGTLAAAMTSFYMCRCLFLTFWGDFRGWALSSGTPHAYAAVASENVRELHDEDHGHGHEDLSLPGAAPRESPPAMTVPLVLLGAASLLAGIALNPVAFRLFMPHFDWLPMEHWLEPVFQDAGRGVSSWAHGDTPSEQEHGKHALEMISLVGAFLAFAVGSGAAWWVYVKEQGAPARALAERFPALHRWALGKWYVDEFYDASVVSGVEALAETAISVDQSVIDMVLARLTGLLAAALGTVLRVVQNGVVHVYSTVMVIGIVGLGWFLVAPHARLSYSASAPGDFLVHAAPGIGYAYRWYVDENGKASSEQFSGQAEMKVHLDEGKTQTVKLEIRNAFGQTTSQTLTLERPASAKADVLGAK